MTTQTTAQQTQKRKTEAPLPPVVPGEVFAEAARSPHRDMPGYFFVAAYRAMGPIFRIVRPGREQVVLAGADANRFMMAEGKTLTSAREVRREQNEEFGVRRTLVSMDGEEHYRHRRVQKRGYARSALDDRYEDLSGRVQTIARRWQPGTRLLAAELFPRLVAEQLAAGVLNHPLGDHLDDITHWVRTVTLETVAKMRPKSELLSPRYLYARRRVYELADAVIAAHRNGANNGRGPDVVDDLLARYDADDDFMTDQELRLAVLGGYIGGLDTVAYTCAFLLYSLLAHPDVLERAVAEVDAAFAGDGLTPATVKEMTTLHHAAMETLRLYPVSFAVKYTVARPFTFAGYRVDEGTELIVATTVPHHLDEHFPDPFRFDVDRYAAPRYEHRQPGAYTPFGVGAHICLGAGMAEVLIMLTMATLLHTVRFDLSPPDYQLQIHAMPTPVPKDLYLRVLEQREQ